MGFCNIEASQFIEPKPGISPGPKHLLLLEKHIKDNDIRAIVWSAVFSGKSAKALAKRSGATLVQLAQGVNEVPAAKDYVLLMDYNLSQLANVYGK